MMTNATAAMQNILKQIAKNDPSLRAEVLRLIAMSNAKA
jgi:hypothetical protein